MKEETVRRMPASAAPVRVASGHALVPNENRFGSLEVTVTRVTTRPGPAIGTGDALDVDIDYHSEHRVAGADANPYLVMAAILAGMLYGLDNLLPLPEPVTGNGLEQEGLPLPIRQSDALYEFEHQHALTHYLGERFTRVYHACKTDELLQFFNFLLRGRDIVDLIGSRVRIASDQRHQLLCHGVQFRSDRLVLLNFGVEEKTGKSQQTQRYDSADD